MTTNRKAELTRGYREGFGQFELLRTKWPKAFPAKSHEVRPLASGAVRVVMETLSWSHPYTRGVLMTWKLRAAYCRAVLGYPQRVNLDGSVSGEEVDDRARAGAQERLDKIAARAAEKAEKLRALKEGNSQDEILEPGRAPMPVRDVAM